MTTVKGETIFGQTIDLDNKRFVGCKFTNCTLRYKGGQVEWDKNTIFISCRWDFLDDAGRTVKVLNIAHTDPTDFHWSNEAFFAH